MYEANKVRGLKRLRAEPRAKLTSMAPDKGKPRCKECGYRVRAKNHEEGDRHRGIVKQCRRK
jgi:hypothetical protein